ncbi:rod shape-determining protein MreD [Proteocatella sphenisci]|uniref:rod shape-determining protein MreD n=1 Tax=Proteocatella sphenisci TaxID=181070 RepID=UPI00048FAAEC|nr:rod shape-determining protein MreD [Proteocatella sphenisci]
MKNILYIAVGLIILIAEIAIANKFPIFGATPDLLLVYIIILSKNTDAKANFIVAVTLGFIKDVLIGLKFGVNIIVLCAVSVFIRFAKDKIYEYIYIYPSIMITLGTIIQILVHAGISQVFFSSITLSTLLVLIVKKSIINCVLGLLIYEPACKAFDKI